MDALCRQLPTVQEEASHLKMFLLAGQSSALGEQAGSLFLPSPGRGRCWRSQPSRPDLAGRWPTEHMNDCFSGQGHVFTGQAWVWAETAERETSWEMDGIKFVAGYLKRPWACRERLPEPHLTVLPLSNVYKRTMSSDIPFCPDGSLVYEVREFPFYRQRNWGWDGEVILLKVIQHVSSRSLNANCKSRVLSIPRHCMGHRFIWVHNHLLCVLLGLVLSLQNGDALIFTLKTLHVCWK